MNQSIMSQLQDKDTKMKGSPSATLPKKLLQINVGDGSTPQKKSKSKAAAIQNRDIEAFISSPVKKSPYNKTSIAKLSNLGGASSSNASLAISSPGKKSMKKEAS